MGKLDNTSVERRVGVMRDLSEGETMSAVARKYGMGSNTVRDIRGEALEAWREANIGAMDDMISREMMRIDSLEEVVMRDYENSKRSLKPMEYAALMARGLSMDEIDECFASRPQSGDPRYLDTLLRIGMQRMRLIGAVGRSDRRKQTINQYNFGNLSEEDMRRIVGEMQDGKYREGR
jgi:hypothetical protein|nr:MAG TPA: Middle operon regulator, TRANSCRIPTION.2A [Caudoviricetes sp.]